MVLHDDDLKQWLSYLETLPNTRANRRFKVICNALLASALRINELLALEITDLDFETNEIIVNKTLMWKSANPKLGIKGQMICKPTPKTDAGNRKVAVPSSIIEELKISMKKWKTILKNIIYLVLHSSSQQFMEIICVIGMKEQH